MSDSAHPDREEPVGIPPVGIPTDQLSWDDLLTDRDKQLLRETSWGKSEPFGLGANPVVIVVDDYHGALGDKREPLFESMKRWPMSCGLDGWKAIDRTVDLLAAARKHDVPIIYIHLIEELIANLRTRSGFRTGEHRAADGPRTRAKRTPGTTSTAAPSRAATSPRPDRGHCSACSSPTGPTATGSAGPFAEIAP